MLSMETIDACLQLLYVHREPAMKRRVLEFVLANADDLERRPTWNEQPFIEQLNADCCELLEKVLAGHEDKIELRFCYKKR